jgi:hypothetical protein
MITTPQPSNLVAQWEKDEELNGNVITMRTESSSASPNHPASLSNMRKPALCSIF